MQFRVFGRNSSSQASTWSEWRDCELGQPKGVNLPFLICLAVEFREKPTFKPAYYEACDATHTIRWFEEPPNDPIWRRIDTLIYKNEKK